jgi:hypothetical protein
VNREMLKTGSGQFCQVPPAAWPLLPRRWWLRKAQSQGSVEQGFFDLTEPNPLQPAYSGPVLDVAPAHVQAAVETALAN